MTKQNHAGGIILADAPKGEESAPSNESEKGLMIESVSIKNFRCFASVEAEDLGLINVVVGDNASGKTAFLEALYLTATNSPQAHLKFLRWRGLAEEQLNFSGTALQSGRYWADLFHWYEQEQPVSVSVKGNPSKELIIELQEVDSVSLDGTTPAPIRFGWSYEGGAFQYAIPTFGEGTFSFPRAGSAIEGAMITVAVSASQLAQRFSDLDIDGRSAEVVSVVSDEFREIVGLSTQADVSAGNLVYAKLKGREKQIPLPHVSAGINRLVYILSTIASFPGGSIYVDEFDVGIYHAHLSAVWSAIYSLAKKQDTQVFLSTHSAEALSALASVIDKREEDCRLIRLRREDGASELEVFEGDDFLAALQGGMEIR